MKKQFLNVLYAFAFCLGSSNVVLSIEEVLEQKKQPSPSTKSAPGFSQYFEITGRHLHDYAHKILLKRTNKNSANETEGVTESQEKAIETTKNDQEPENNHDKKPNTWAEDMTKLFRSRKAYAQEQARIKLEQAQAKATETATEKVDQAKINLASAFTSLVSKVPAGFSAGRDIVTKKCTDFMTRIKTAWELRKTLNILIGKVKAEGFTGFSDNEAEKLKTSYDSLPVDKKAKVLNAWLEQREKISNQALKDGIKNATQAFNAEKKSINNISVNDIKKLNTQTLDQRIQSLKDASETSLRDDVKAMARSLQPELGRDQIVTPVELADAKTGKVVSIRFDVIDLKDINLKEPLVGKKITNPDRTESYENSTHRNLLAMQGKLNMNSESLENVVSQYFADKVDLAKITKEKLKTLLNLAPRSVNTFTKEQKEKFNILIPEFNGTKFSDFSPQLKTDILSKAMAKDKPALAQAEAKKPATTTTINQKTAYTTTQLSETGSEDRVLREEEQLGLRLTEGQATNQTNETRNTSTNLEPKELGDLSWLTQKNQAATLLVPERNNTNQPAAKQPAAKQPAAKQVASEAQPGWWLSLRSIFNKKGSTDVDDNAFKHLNS